MAHASSNILIGFEYDKEFETNDSMIIWFIQKFYQHKIDFEGINTKEDFVDILIVTGLFHLVDNKLVVGKVVSDPGKVTKETIKALPFSNMIETYDSVIEYKDFFQSNSVINCYHGTWLVELKQDISFDDAMKSLQVTRDRITDSNIRQKQLITEGCRSYIPVDKLKEVK